MFIIYQCRKIEHIDFYFNKCYNKNGVEKKDKFLNIILIIHIMLKILLKYTLMEFLFFLPCNSFFVYIFAFKAIYRWFFYNIHKK